MIKRGSQVAAELMHSALCRMVKKYPYHAEWLSWNRWRERQGIATMAVTVRGGHVAFYYDERFVCRCTPEELEGVIHHELNHLVFGHPFVDPNEFPNRHARVIAEEVTVNEFIPESLPGNPLMLADFKELPPNEDTDTRYHRLAMRSDLADRVRLLDLHSLWKEVPSPGDWIQDAAAVRKALNVRHAVGPGLSDILQWAVAAPIELGEAVVESLQGLGERAKPLNWQSILADVTSTQVYQEASYHRPPRRFPHLSGVFPGTTIQIEKPRAMVAIDTSRSMHGPQFERVKAELDQICEITDVTVVQCDTEIRSTQQLNGSLKEIMGRGGTDLRPPFERKVVSEIDPAVIVYFTDGAGVAPPEAPHVPVIWCLTPTGKEPTAWGRVVRMLS